MLASFAPCGHTMNLLSGPSKSGPMLAVLAALLSALLVLPGSSIAAASALTLQACRLPGHPTEIQCGKLSRPLDPNQPSGKTIELRVAVVPALARNKLPDPVVFLAGGPGQAAVELLPMLARRHGRLNQRRDLVFVDQRGTGQSAALECPEEQGLRLAEQLDLQAIHRRLEACREQLMKLPHGDLRQYTTPIAMQDLDAVRQALGIAQWNLVGGSYGTRAGLDYLRQFPQATRRAVLDGVAPATMAMPASFSTDNQAALNAVLAACSAQTQCKANYPDLQGQWNRLMASLPRDVLLVQPMTGAQEAARIEAHHVLGAVRGALYAPALASALPAVIAAAAQGNFTPLSGLAAGTGTRRATRVAQGMHFSVMCAEDLPRLAANQDPVGSDYQQMDRQFYERACKDWPRGDLPAAFYTLPKAQVAVLILSGGADPATPTRHGQSVAQALGAMAKHQVVAEAGHGVMNLPCMGDVLASFIEAKTDADALSVKTDCAVAMPRPLAFVPPNPHLPPVKSKENAL
jgi:pimeloyl-ACP methyl ester carboxylesterase